MVVKIIARIGAYYIKRNGKKYIDKYLRSQVKPKNFGRATTVIKQAIPFISHKTMNFLKDQYNTHKHRLPDLDFSTKKGAGGLENILDK